MNELISLKERDIMTHACAWNSRKPLYRNYFVAATGSDDWSTIQGLIDRGLMKKAQNASDLTGDMPVFKVTEKGLKALALTT